MREPCNGKYAEIINLPHYQSKKRAQMSNYDRAAQFSPFAALTGYEAAVAEAGRLTDERLELSEERAQFLDSCLELIKEHLAEQPAISITYFQPDPQKSGGQYLCLSGRVKRIAEAERRLILTDGTEILFADIFNLEGQLLEGLQNTF